MKLTSKKTQIENENQLSNKDLSENDNNDVENDKDKENKNSLETPSDNDLENLMEETEKHLIEKPKIKSIMQNVKYNFFEGYQFINFEINNIVEIIFNLQPLLLLENVVDALKNRLIPNSLEGNDLNLIFKIMAFSKLND